MKGTDRVYVINWSVIYEVNAEPGAFGLVAHQASCTKTVGRRGIFPLGFAPTRFCMGKSLITWY